VHSLAGMSIFGQADVQSINASEDVRMRLSLQLVSAAERHNDCIPSSFILHDR